MLAGGARDVSEELAHGTCGGNTCCSEPCFCPCHDEPAAAEEPPEVRKVAAHMPVSMEQLIDAGYPAPPGYEPPPRPKVSRWQRWRWRWVCWKGDTRERIGFWIAGHDPREEDW